MNSESSIYALILFVLLIVPTVIGIVISRRKEKSPEEYFLGSRSLGIVVLGNTLFLSALGSFWLLIAVNAVPSGFSLSIQPAFVFAGVSVAVLLVLGYFIAPMYLKSRVFTVPQFVSYRFDGRAGLLWSSISIMFYVAVKIPLLIAVTHLTTRSMWGWEIFSSAGLIVAIVLTGLHTVMGGFTSVVRTQLLQVGMALGGVLIILWHMAAHPFLESGITSGGRIVGATLLALPIILAWHWWLDQSAVQRVCAARNAEIARKGIMAASIGLLAVLAIWLNVATPAPADMTSWMGKSYLLRGIGSTVSLLLFMALLAGDMHSTATLLSMDMYRMKRPEASDETLVLIGRLASTIVVVFAILMVSANTLVNTSIMVVIREVPFFIAPPIVATAVIGVFWSRMNATGAFWALLIGETLGIASLVARFVDASSAFGIGGMPLDRLCVLSFSLTGILFVCISLATAAPSEESIAYMSIVRRKQG